MSIFRKVTLEILKKNKTRTLVTIIGIILSAAMFTAVTTTISSLQNYMLQNSIYNYGDWHISVDEMDASFFDFMRDPAAVLMDENEKAYFENGKVESYVHSQVLGYAYAEGCTNDYKPYLYIIGVDKDFCETMPVHMTGGRLPENSNEIILPEHLAENGEVYYKVGDVLTLEIGNRVSDGFRLGQHNPYMNEPEEENIENAGENSTENEGGGPSEEIETLEVYETRTYTVVGFYERPSFENYSAPGYTAITAMDKVRPEGALYNFYFKMKNPQDAMDWFEHLTTGGVSYNRDVLIYLGVSEINSFYTILYGLGAIVCGLIMFGSVSLIYNAFSISVSERTKQFGLLSSIGATKKQIRQMVLFEALFVSGIGIPLGILAGVGGMGVTFHFIGKEFSSLTDYVYPLTLSVYPWAIVAACVITLTTVIVSAWIPSERATMVTAVEAIRQSTDIKLTKREQKRLCRGTGKGGVYRVFGFPGMIANKYYMRSRKKYRTTVVSLFMSIVLFISASALTTYLTDSVESSFEKNGYDLVYTYDPTMYMTYEEIERDEFSGLIGHAELSSLFDTAEGVTSATYVARNPSRVPIEPQYLAESYVNFLTNKYETLGINYDISSHEVFVCAIFVEDSVFEEFLKEQKLEREIYMNEEQPLGVAIDGNTFWDYDLQKFVTTDILKSDYAKIVIGTETEQTTLQVGAIVKERPYFVNDVYELPIIYPYSLRETVLQDLTTSNHFCDHYILSEDHKASYTDLKEIVVNNGLLKHYLYDYAEGVDESRTLIMIIKVFSYGFIVLISLIAAANVFNTISTNISLRRREFAMLKSVGMSNKEMGRMMNYECILYGTRAILYGMPVSIVITWLIYRVISEGFSTGFYLPWGAIAIAILSVFLMVFATMMYSMRKIQADNPIEALKNENL